MLDKLGGTWAPRPSSGPHKIRECLPLILILRNRLKYALTRREVIKICAGRMVKVDGVVRTDPNFPVGLFDVVSLDASNEHYRLVYDAKGRFALVPISEEDAKKKLGRVRRAQLGPKGIPYVTLHDGRTIRYPDPDIRVADTVTLDIASNKIIDHLRFDMGATALVTGGRNIGRAGSIVGKEKHLGGFAIIRIRDQAGNEFATRMGNVFVVGDHGKSLVKFPGRVGSGGVRISLQEDRAKRIASHSK